MNYRKLQNFVDWFLPVFCISLLVLLAAYHSGLINWVIVTFRTPTTLGESFVIFTVSMALLVIVKAASKLRL